MMTTNETWSDKAIPPGEMLRLLLEMNKVHDLESVRNAPGMPREALEDLLAERTGMSPELADALAKAMDTPAYVWYNMQRDYEQHLQVIAERKDAD